MRISLTCCKKYIPLFHNIISCYIYEHTKNRDFFFMPRHQIHKYRQRAKPITRFHEGVSLRLGCVLDRGSACQKRMDVSRKLPLYLIILIESGGSIKLIDYVVNLLVQGWWFEGSVASSTHFSWLALFWWKKLLVGS